MADTDMRTTGMPVVAVVGRPNVGKSSLVNRVLGRREAIVQETPGVTRDRRSFEAEWNGRRFELIDTGGLEPGAEGIDARIAEQAQVAMEAADLIVFVVDSTTGSTQDDLAVAHMLRRSTRPILVVVNKVDSPNDLIATSDFHSLGLGEPLAVSALHGLGSGDLLAAIVERLPERSEVRGAEWASIALVGRPNVGKSSILNRLLGEERSIVDATPGTTRDPIDSLIELEDGKRLRIVDTAGMRRQVQIKDPIEYFSFLRSRGTLDRVDAAVLVVDAGEGMTGHDQRIAREILDAGRACVVVLNKWDLVPGSGPDRDRYDRTLDHELRFLSWAPRVRASAKTKRAMDKIIPATMEAVRSHRTRLSTSHVNRVIREAQQLKPHPRSGGRGVRILYAVQASVAPPTVILFTNAPLEPSYVRYLESKVRDEEPFTGSPVRFRIRQKSRSQGEL